MYYRLYPSKGNTIFQQYSPNTFTPISWSSKVNTGSNPVMQLMDGSAYSKILLGFNIPVWLQNKIRNYNFNCNLKLYDAGAIYDSLLPMKELKLQYFFDDFSEGNGWSFNQSNASEGISNWTNNLSSNLWSAVAFTDVSTQYLNTNNQDLVFNVKSAIESMIEDPANINFSLSVNTPEYNQNNLIKFIWGIHTKTVFKPYIEFFIEDEVIDSSYNLMAGDDNRVYFINENGVDFTDELSASITLNDNSIIPYTAINMGNGIYYIVVNPMEPSRINKKEYISIIWKINSNPVYKQIIEVKPKNQFLNDVNYRNVMFYPTTPYTHNIIRQGDIIPFDVVSQMRGKNDVIMDTYEYRIVSQDGFEMCPWTHVSVYRDKMYFFVNTLYLYPEMSYEVFIRNNMDNFSITSNLTHKFKLIANDASHLRELSASPYFSRETFFSK